MDKGNIDKTYFLFRLYTVSSSVLDIDFGTILIDFCSAACRYIVVFVSPMTLVW